MPARYKGAYGGRGSGKSHFFAEEAIKRCLRDHGTRIVCVREVQKSLMESVKLLLEDKIMQFDVGHEFQVRDKLIRTPGDGLILFQGMQDHTAESIKSLEGFHVAYVEEAQTLTKHSLELLRPTMRTKYPDGTWSELWFSWNPRSSSDPVDALLRGPTPPPDSVVVNSNYINNPFFPKVLDEERLYDQITSPDRYGHIWLGEYEPTALGAIFSLANINEHRTTPENVPDLKRIIVSIDPAGSSEKGANETGIVVCALGENGRGYVLDDLSLLGGPKEWAERAIAAYDMYEADAIVAEVNFGGDMVAHTIRAHRPNVRIVEVRALRTPRETTAPGTKRTHKAKALRAEPISALYQLGKVSHVGAFPELEAQMVLVTASGYEGRGSPDRVDALVHGFTELFPRMVRRTRPKGSLPPQRANSGYDPHHMHG